MKKVIAFPFYACIAVLGDQSVILTYSTVLLDRLTPYPIFSFLILIQLAVSYIQKLRSLTAEHYQQKFWVFLQLQPQRIMNFKTASCIHLYLSEMTCNHSDNAVGGTLMRLHLSQSRAFFNFILSAIGENTIMILIIVKMPNIRCHYWSGRSHISSCVYANIISTFTKSLQLG